MKDSSGPHRLEKLESKAEKMVDMTSQPIEATSAGGGQQREEEESGGTDRGAAQTTAAAPGGHRPLLTQVMVLQQSELQQLGKYPSRKGKVASELTRPADDIDRRPEVPAGVGPMVNMYSGDARESHLSGIGAHDGG